MKIGIRYRITRVVANGVERIATLFAHENDADIVVERDVNYIEGDADALCDYYYPKCEGRRPLIIYIHGGGYVSGIKELRAQYCYKFTEKGFFALNVNYSYAPEATHPVQLRQIFKAIEKVVSEADRYDLDLTRVVIAGESAGAYFASFVAAITTKPELYDELGIDFRYRDTFRIRAAILLNGAYNMQNMVSSKFANMTTYMSAYLGVTPKQFKGMEGHEILDRISPITYVGEDYPPSVIITGKLDKLMPEGVELAERLARLGVRYFYYMGSGVMAMHAGGIMVRSHSADTCMRLTQSFVFKELGILKNDPNPVRRRRCRIRR